MSVAVRVIPCLDVNGGRVVKGVNFADLRDPGDPVEMARSTTRGRRRADVPERYRVHRTARHDVRRGGPHGRAGGHPARHGGGIRTGDVDRLLRAGADKVSINTAAIARPQLLDEASRRFGAVVERNDLSYCMKSWTDER